MLESRRPWFLLVLVLAATLYLVRLGHPPLFDPDEARFARTSVEMARTGDLVVPRFLGEPRLQKPPLLHWAQAALFATFGPDEFLARLPSALAALGTVFLAGLAARRKFGAEAAAWTAASLGSMPLVVLIARSGVTDAILAVHVSAAVFLDLAPPSEDRSGKPVLFGVLLALGFLSKGPIGVLLPLVIVLAGRTASGAEVWPGWRTIGLASATTAAVVAPWGLALLDRVGWPAIQAVVESELAGRIIEGAGHPEPPWFYLVALPVVTLPWVPAIVIAGARALGRWTDPQSRTARYAVAGLLAGIGLLSLSEGKVASYLLPLMPLAALLVAREVGESLRGPSLRCGSLLLVAMSLLAEAVAIAAVGPRFVEASGLWLPAAMAGVLVVGAAGTTLGWVTRRPRAAWAAAAAAQAAAIAVLVWFPPHELLERRSTAYLVRASPELKGPEPIVMAMDPHPSLSFYTGRVPEFAGLSDLPDRLTGENEEYWVFELDDWNALDAGLRGRFRVVRRVGYFLVATPGTAERRRN